MTESSDTIRTLGLGQVVEDLYFGRDVPANLRIHMRCPSEFRNAKLRRRQRRAADAESFGSKYNRNDLRVARQCGYPS
jgi:hypothetical protein